MKKFYISSKKDISGIGKYSQDFYQFILKEKGFIHIDSAEHLSTILTTIASEDHIHIELGVFHKKEIEILFTMLKANYRNVAVTLHDAPFIKHPYYEFKNPGLNRISKFIDKYANSFGGPNPFVRKIKAIYVLSKQSIETVKQKYQVEQVYYLPYIINVSELEKKEINNKNFVYAGAMNSSIDYSLLLHQQLMARFPDSRYYIMTSSTEKKNPFFESLREKYTQNVYYVNCVSEKELHETLNQATFALLFFKKTDYFPSVRESVFNNLKKGKILFTNKIRALMELVENGKNGFFLSGELKSDVETMTKIINNQPLLCSIRDDMFNYLRLYHSADEIRKRIKD